MLSNAGDVGTDISPVLERWGWLIGAVSVLLASFILLIVQGTYPSYMFWWISYGYLLAVVATVLLVGILADDLKRSASNNYQPRFSGDTFQNAGRYSRMIGFVIAMAHIAMAAKDASR